ncbi:lipid II flippase MurJ [Demequina sp.]|uniref:murein biosynthesis integral membrane protein MurJ n=1 Tax=Demequina sp. TaxID=2050685 RepID=UPI0025BD2719|nr:lipid II flippase MurJ [Demequina sp.]
MTSDTGDATPPVDPTGPGDKTGTGTASSGRVGRHTMVMASGTLVSRALGLVRSMLLFAAIGLTGSVAAEAYGVANKLPNVMFAVLAAGVLNSALVPQIVRSFQADRVRTVHRILTLGGVGMLAVTTLLTVTAGFWVRVYSDGWGPEQTALATAFALWCIPQLLFYGLYTLFGQVLNAREQFGPFMWAPVANNVVAIAGLAAFLVIFGPYALDESASVQAIVDEWTTGKILLVAAVATLGIAVQALVLIPPMIRGGYRWRWVWRGPKGELSTVTRVAGWALGAVLVEQLAVLLITRVATAAQAAAPTDPGVAGVLAYDAALGIFLVPHSLVSISLMTVLFTQMSRHAALGDVSRVRGVMSEGVRMVGVFTMLASVTMAVTAPHLVRVLAPTVQAESVEAVAWVLRLMVIGLVPLGASLMIRQAYFALEDGRTVFLIHIPMALAWLAVAYGIQAFTEPQWWVRGIALGLAATNTVAVVLRLWGLRRRLAGVDGRRILVTHAKALVAAIAATGVGVALMMLAPRTYAEEGAQAVAVSGLLTIGIAGAMAVLYGVASRLLRVEEANAVVRAVNRRLRRVR